MVSRSLVPTAANTPGSAPVETLIAEWSGLIELADDESFIGAARPFVPLKTGRLSISENEVTVELGASSFKGIVQNINTGTVIESDGDGRDRGHTNLILLEKNVTGAKCDEQMGRVIHKSIGTHECLGCVV